jgi:hypothetical protein
VQARGPRAPGDARRTRAAAPAAPAACAPHTGEVCTRVAWCIPPRASAGAVMLFVAPPPTRADRLAPEGRGGVLCCQQLVVQVLAAGQQHARADSRHHMLPAAAVDVGDGVVTAAARWQATDVAVGEAAMGEQQAWQRRKRSLTTIACSTPNPGPPPLARPRTLCLAAM